VLGNVGELHRVRRLRNELALHQVDVHCRCGPPAASFAPVTGQAAPGVGRATRLAPVRIPSPTLSLALGEPRARRQDSGASVQAPQNMRPGAGSRSRVRQPSTARADRRRRTRRSLTRLRSHSEDRHLRSRSFNHEPHHGAEQPGSWGRDLLP